MSTLVNFEPLVDSATVAFLEQLKERFAGNENGMPICDFGVWLQYYAFDVIGELTYSKRLGFVDQGMDVDHIANLEWLLNYSSVVSTSVMYFQAECYDHLRKHSDFVADRGSSMATIGRSNLSQEPNPSLDEQAQAPRLEYACRSAREKMHRLALCQHFGKASGWFREEPKRPGREKRFLLALCRSNGK